MLHLFITREVTSEFTCVSDVHLRLDSCKHAHQNQVGRFEQDLRIWRNTFKLGLVGKPDGW